jgi:hypothetical protein
MHGFHPPVVDNRWMKERKETEKTSGEIEAITG